jgi:hypothetical protein
MGWRSTRRGAAIALVVVLALAAGARAPSAADAAVTFGSTLPAPSAGFYDSCDQPCTAAQVELPGAKTRSPVDGTIVRFRLRTGAGSDAQQVKFRVLRSSDGVNFIGAGTSAAFNLPTTAGITEFPVNMPVRTGDYVGIDLPGGSKRAVIIAQNAGAFQAGWFPTLADSGAARPSGNPRGSEPTVFDVLLQADVEPSSTPSPTPPAAPVALNCTSSRQVATCPDPSQPAMCGPTSLGFPQCSLPLSLPTVCSGTGTGLPVCNLPGNYVVACGGLGLNLGVCKLPPVSVPSGLWADDRRATAVRGGQQPGPRLRPEHRRAACLQLQDADRGTQADRHQLRRARPRHRLPRDGGRLRSRGDRRRAAEDLRRRRRPR